MGIRSIRNARGTWGIRGTWATIALRQCTSGSRAPGPCLKALGALGASGAWGARGALGTWGVCGACGACDIRATPTWNRCAVMPRGPDLRRHERSAPRDSSGAGRTRFLHGRENPSPAPPHAAELPEVPQVPLVFQLLQVPQAPWCAPRSSGAPSAPSVPGAPTDPCAPSAPGDPAARSAPRWP